MPLLHKGKKEKKWNWITTFNQVSEGKDMYTHKSKFNFQILT